MNKNLQLTIAWFVLAFLVTLAAVWQAQVTVAREVLAKNQPPPPPAKTRSAVRGTTTAPPPLDYATRKKQGLTDREIGWIMEDFQSAGLDLGIRAAPREDYLAQRKAQDRWYRDALVEAWSLTPEQSAQVTAKLAELYDQAKADFIEALAAGPQPVEINGQWYIITSADPIHRLIDANRRLQDAEGPFMPWKLGGFPAASPRRTSEEIHPADSNLAAVDLLLPRSAPSSEDGAAQTAPQEDGILPQLRKLHPAQLKLLLLIAPGKAKEIQAALEAG
jgi:hypothetical protein